MSDMNCLKAVNRVIMKGQEVEMVALKGRYDGSTVIFDRKPSVPAGEVIVTFLDSSEPISTVDDGSLGYLFNGYTDDGIREPLVDFGDAIGNEQW
jgi:hypothetical protein